MTPYLLRLTLLTGILTFCACSVAQIDNMQWWANYTHNQSVSEHWQLSLRSEMRYYDCAQNLYRAGISPKVQYKGEHNLKYIIASRFFYYNTISRDGTMEYRPWLGLSYSHSINTTFDISHSTRWEHRLWEDETTSYESRVRYKFKIGAILLNGNEKSLKIAFSPEFFWSLGDLDGICYKNTRWGIPISFRYSKTLMVEVVPFLQTNHNGFANILDDKNGLIQLNLKTFL